MRFLIGTLASLALLLASQVWGQEYLYQPRLLAEGEQVKPADGVLVRVVQVKKGDTLSRISKRFSGRAAYYPQILLFNSIRNPHLIYPGDLLRIPVSGQSPAQQVAPVRQTAPPVAARQPVALPTEPKKVVAVPTPRQDNAEQGRYASALAAFKRGDCVEAVAQFERFMTDFPRSPLLPDAILNRAECYLKLSAK